jgi:predicted nucleic acid-binding protein
MPLVKLTLSADRDLIEQAKKLAGAEIRGPMRDIFTAGPLDAQVLNQAIDAGFSDFEDAIQFHSAVHAGADCLITRDAEHFPATTFPVLTPLEFLASQFTE